MMQQEVSRLPGIAVPPGLPSPIDVGGVELTTQVCFPSPDLVALVLDFPMLLFDDSVCFPFTSQPPRGQNRLPSGNARSHNERECHHGADGKGHLVPPDKFAEPIGG